MKRVKTYKREVAVIQLVLHWALVMFICWLVYNDKPVDGVIDLAVGLAVWVYGFAAAAFGMDSWAKQVNTQPQEDVLGD